jgi:hypothetical protein
LAKSDHPAHFRTWPRDTRRARADRDYGAVAQPSPANLARTGSEERDQSEAGRGRAGIELAAFARGQAVLADIPNLRTQRHGLHLTKRSVEYIIVRLLPRLTGSGTWEIERVVFYRQRNRVSIQGFDES